MTIRQTLDATGKVMERCFPDPIIRENVKVSLSFLITKLRMSDLLTDSISEDQQVELVRAEIVKNDVLFDLEMKPLATMAEMIGFLKESCFLDCEQIGENIVRIKMPM